MADKFNKNKNRSVDDAGIRLAPPPINNAAYHVMPTVMQEYVIEPTIVNKETPDSDSRRIVSTVDDVQPKREEVNKKWKRGKRAKNMASGIIALVASVAVLLPYVLRQSEQVSTRRSRWCLTNSTSCQTWFPLLKIRRNLVGAAAKSARSG